jgi:hypothetical protein
MAAARCRRHMGDNPAHRADDGARESDSREYLENADARSADTSRK